jgi:hypothetical protein
MALVVVIMPALGGAKNPRRINLTVPGVLHKIHRLAAGVVTAAMFTPVLFMAGRHTQVNGLAHQRHWSLFNDDGLWINQYRRGGTSQVNAAIKPRL